MLLQALIILHFCWMYVLGNMNIFGYCILINHLLSSHRCLRLPLRSNSITRIFLTLPFKGSYSHTLYWECFKVSSRRRYPRFCGRRRSMLQLASLGKASSCAVPRAKSREVTLPSDSRSVLVLLGVEVC